MNFEEIPKKNIFFLKNSIFFDFNHFCSGLFTFKIYKIQIFLISVCLSYSNLIEHESVSQRHVSVLFQRPLHHFHRSVVISRSDIEYVAHQIVQIHVGRNVGNSVVLREGRPSDHQESSHFGPIRVHSMSG